MVNICLENVEFRFGLIVTYPTADWAGCHLISINLSELCCPHCSRDARGVHQIGALIPGGAVVTVGDPDHLAVREAGGR